MVALRVLDLPSVHSSFPHPFLIFIQIVKNVFYLGYSSEDRETQNILSAAANRADKSSMKFQVRDYE